MTSDVRFPQWTAGAAATMLGIDDPDALELATSLSLAARIDTALIRVVRTELHPAMPATAEAAFWFGPLVSRRGGGTVTVDREVLPWLRGRLVDRPDEGRASAQAVRILLRAVRDGENAGPYLRLEEDLTWIGLRGGEPDEVNQRLAHVFSDLRSDGSLARDVALWAARVLPRLPARTVAGSAAMWLLAQAASARLGGISIVDVEPPGVDVGRWLPHVLPADARRVEVGARLVSGSLELSLPPAPGAHRMTAPATEPVVVELLGPGLVPADRASGPPGDGPRVLLYRCRTVPRDAEANAAAALDEAGFQVVRGEFQAMPADRWRATAGSCQVVVFLVDDDHSEAQTMSRTLEATVPTFTVGASDQRFLAEEPRIPFASRDDLLRLLAPVMLAAGRRDVVAVRRGRRVRLPVGGAVWLRTADGSWNVLNDQIPPRLKELGPEDPPRIGDYRLLRIVSDGPEQVYLGRAAGRPLAAVTVLPKWVELLDSDFDEVVRRWRGITETGVAKVQEAAQDAAPPYIATEFIDGERLDGRVARGGFLAGDELTSFAVDLARSLAAIHAVGLVHRHLGAGVVLLGRSGWRIIGLHLAALAGTVPGPSRRLASNEPHPVPERRNGQPAQCSEDVFGWAGLVYRAAFGRLSPPVEAATRMEPTLAYLIEAASASDPTARPTAVELLRALRAVVAGLPAGAEPQETAGAISRGGRRERDTAELTTQELAVGRLAATGLTNRQVARELIVSVKTVEYHLRNIFGKLDVASRSQLAAKLAESPGDEVSGRVAGDGSASSC